MFSEQTGSIATFEKFINDFFTVSQRPKDAERESSIDHVMWKKWRKGFSINDLVLRSSKPILSPKNNVRMNCN